MIDDDGIQILLSIVADEIILWCASYNVCTISSCEVFNNVSALLLVKKCDYLWLYSFAVVDDFT